MKKNTDTTLLSSELSTGTAFFNPTKTVQNITTKTERTNDATKQRSNVSTKSEVRQPTNQTWLSSEHTSLITPDFSVRKDRFSFEVREDLHKLIEDVRDLYRTKYGKRPSISAIVNRALDPYLKKTIKELLQ